jgi:hypothetical protein
VLQSSLHSLPSKLLKANEQFVVRNFKIGSDFYLKLAHGVEEPKDVGFDIGAQALFLESDVNQDHQKSLELLTRQSVDLLKGLY